MTDRRDNSEVLDAIKRVEGKVDSLSETINGNGKPGMKTTLALTEQKIDNHLEDAKMHQSRWSGVIPIAMSSIISGLIVGGFFIVMGAK